MTRAEALAMVTAPLATGIARRVIRETLAGWPDADVAEWHRLKDMERKRAKPQFRSGQNRQTGTIPAGTSVESRNGSGLHEIGKPEQPPSPSSPPSSPPAPPLLPPLTPPSSLSAASGRPGAGGQKSDKAGKPVTVEAKMLADLFRRSHETRWSNREVAKFLEQRPSVRDIEKVANYYQSERTKGRDGIHRRDLLTLLNNWPGEVDRANAWADAGDEAGPAERPKPAFSWPAFKAWAAKNHPDFNLDGGPGVIPAAMRREFDASAA